MSGWPIVLIVIVLARLRVFPHFQTFSIPYWLDFRRPKEKRVVVVFRRLEHCFLTNYFDLAYLNDSCKVFIYLY